MYSDKVMDHFANPRNVGVIEDANIVVQVGDPGCDPDAARRRGTEGFHEDPAVLAADAVQSGSGR